MDWDNITRTGARAPGVERQQSLAWLCLATQEADGAERRQNRCEWRARRMEANRGLVPGMPGAGLTGRNFGKALSETPALEPYWGKPAVRNLREDNGNVGIIRSPVRAIVLPDLPPPSMNPVWGNPVSNPRPAAVASCGCGNEAQGAWRYREAKVTKRRGRDGRKSECFTVPRKRGNQPEGPRRGKEAPEHGHVRGKDGGDTGLHNRINET